MTFFKAIMVMAVFIVACNPAFAQQQPSTGEPPIGKDVSSADHPGYAEDYPGWATDQSKVTDVGQFWACKSLQQYYMLHGSWPSSWEDVVADGLIQVQLFGYNLEVIDPDDNSLDFYGDLVFDPKVQDNGNVLVFELRYIQGPSVDRIEVPAPGTYEEWFESMADSRDDPRFRAYLQDPIIMKLFGCVGQFRSAAFLYWQLHDYYPCTLIDLLESNLAPFDNASINPATGRPFSGEGKANDIYYEWIDDSKAVIEPVQISGERWDFFFSL